jgi:hypothetical protein
LTVHHFLADIYFMVHGAKNLCCSTTWATTSMAG